MSAEDVVDDHDLTDPTRLRRPLPGPLGRLRPWIDWFGLRRVLAGMATVVVVVVGGWWLLRSPAPPTEAGLPYASPATTTSTPGSTPVATAAVPASMTAGPIVVHVAGAVARPGVYELPGDARVHTAIEMAGGWRPEADPSALNLAAVVADGERIYVPAIGETVPLPPVVPGAADAAQPAGPVDLNRAGADELDELPGIGPATAAAIVDHRTEHGPFATVDDLEAVSGIGPAKLAAIRDLVRV